jgi:hypothetical protein
LSAVKAESTRAVIRRIYESPRAADAPLITKRVCSSIISYPAFVAEHLIQSFDKSFQVGHFSERELKEFIQESKNILEKYVGMFAVAQQALDAAISEEIREQVKFKLNKREELIKKVLIALSQRQRDFLPGIKVAPEWVEPPKTKIRKMEVEELKREKFADWVKKFLSMSAWNSDISDEEVQFWATNLRTAIEKVISPGTPADDLPKTLSDLGTWLDSGKIVRNLVLQTDPSIDKKLLDSRGATAKRILGQIFHEAAK